MSDMQRAKALADQCQADAADVNLICAGYENGLPAEAKTVVDGTLKRMNAALAEIREIEAAHWRGWREVSRA